MKPLKNLFIGGVCLLVISSSFGQTIAQLPATTPWDIKALSQSSPKFLWLDQDEPRKVRPMTYAGEPYKGDPTRVFAWYSSPSTLGIELDKKSFPGIVLVHGGGGTAFAEWAELWARRGYAAIAMDLAGCGEGRQQLPDGGPGQSDQEKFRSIDGPIKDQWTYHAVANVIRAHSWLLNLEEVKGQKTALTGISWGGYLTCIVAGLDPRFEVAMPVYGCGYLRDNSAWVESQFNKMTPAQVERWHQLWDPSQYVGAARMPVMFLNGTEDFAYPMDSYAKTCALVQGEKNYSIQLHMRHGHIFDFPEFFGFIDQYILGAPSMPKVSKPLLNEGRVHALVTSPTPLISARLHYTTGPHSENPKRSWSSVDLQVDGNTITGQAPPPQATVWYVDITDSRKLQVSSELIGPITGAP